MNKKTAILIILLVILVLGIFIWHKNVKKDMVSLLGKRFNHKMLVGDVKWSLFGNILLTDVCIKNPDRPGDKIYIQGIRLRYNPLKRSLSRIELIRPNLKLLKDKEGRWGLDVFRRVERDHIPEILIKEGSLKVCDEVTKDSLYFNKVNGSIRSNKTTLKLVEGEIRWRMIDKPLQVLSLSLSLNNERVLIDNLIIGYKGIEFSFKACSNLREKEIDFEGVSNIFNLKSLSGLFLKKEVNDYIERINLEGQFKFKGEIYYPKEKPFITGEIVLISKSLPSIFARVFYQDSLLTLSPLLIKDSRMVGDINFKDMGLLNLKLNLQRLDPKIIFTFIGRDIDYPYLIDGKIEINGPIKKPLVKGGVILLPSDLKNKIKDLKINFFSEGKRIKIDSFNITHENGLVLFLKGSTEESARDIYSLNMDGSLSIAKWNMGSKVEFNGEARRILSDPYVIGSLNLRRVFINRESIGDFLYQIRYHKSTIFLSPSQASSRDLSGLLSLSPFRMNLKISLDDLELRPLFSAVGLAGIEGILTGGITLKKESYSDLVVEGEGLKIKETNLLGRSSGILSFRAKGEMVDLLGVELRQPNGGVLSAFGRLWLKRESLDLTAECKDIKVENALIRGNLRAEGEFSKFRVSGFLKRLRGSPFNIESINGKLGLVKGRLIVNLLTAKVGQNGEVYIHGSFPLTCKEEGLDFHLKRLKWQEIPWMKDYFRKWQGEMNISGKFWKTLDGPRLSCNLYPSAVKIKEDIFKEFKGSLDYEKGRFKIRINPTPNLILDGEVIPSTLSLNLKTKITEERLSILTKLLPFSFGSFDGIARGEVAIGQDLKDPLIRGDLSIDTKSEIGELKLKFLIKDKIFSIDTFHIQQRAGHLSVEKCQIGPLPNGKVDILAELVDFKLTGPRLTGKISLNGLLNYGSVKLEGRLSSESLWVNRRYEFKDLTTRLIYDSKKGLRFLPLASKTTLAGLIEAPKSGRSFIKGVKILQGGRRLVLLDGEFDLERKGLDLLIKVEDVDLGLLLQPLKAIEEVEGLCSGRLHLKGGFINPAISGEIIAEAKRVKIRYIVDELKSLKTKIIIDDKITIEKLHVKAGKGNLCVALKDITEDKIDLLIQIEKDPLKVNIPGFVEGGIISNLHLVGSYKEPVCTGEIELYNTRFTYPPGKDSIIENEIFNRIDWNLKLIAKKNVRYYNDYVDVELKDESWVNISGRGKDRRVGGLVWSKPNRGRISFLGTPFVIKEAELIFKEDKRPPFILGNAKANVSGIEIELTHNGRLFEVEPVLSVVGSFPQKTREEIIRLLRFGRDYSRISEEDSKVLLRIGMIRLASGQLSSSLIHPLERRLGSLLNIDLNIETPIVEKVFSNSSQSPLADTELSLGNYIMDDLYFRYQAKILEKSKGDGLKTSHTFGLEYQFPEEESIEYEVKTDEELKKEEERIMLKKEIEF